MTGLAKVGADLTVHTNQLRDRIIGFVTVQIMGLSLKNRAQNSDRINSYLLELSACRMREQLALHDTADPRNNMGDYDVTQAGITQPTSD